MTENWNKVPENPEAGLAFMNELNSLLQRHRVTIIAVNGPVLTLKFDSPGGGYTGFCGPQSKGKWVISAPWGG